MPLLPAAQGTCRLGIGKVEMLPLSGVAVHMSPERAKEMPARLEGEPDRARARRRQDGQRLTARHQAARVDQIEILLGGFVEAGQ